MEKKVVKLAKISDYNRKTIKVPINATRLKSLRLQPLFILAKSEFTLETSGMPVTAKS